MQLKTGDIFAEHYQLQKRLGAGGFGEVWLAWNLLADVEVAIKIYGLLDDYGIKSFREEFKIAYKLHHPNLLHLNHFDVNEQCPFLVMPYCSKGSSSTLSGKMSERDIWYFIRDVSCGLMFLHSQHPPIIHQDIKPDNILIGDNGKYIISDFGISRKLEYTFRKSLSKTESSGTLAYMGPERFSENPSIVATSDIWALGMSVYELATGRLLWEGMGGCTQLNGARIPSLNKQYSSQLSKFIHTCLSLNTWDRPTAKQAYEYVCTILEQQTESSYSSKIKHSEKSVASQAISKYILQKHFQNLNKHLVWWSIMGILLISLLVKGVFSLFASIEEERVYTACQTIEDFQQFLNRYPSSSHSEFIKQKIGLLKEDSTRKSQKREAINKIAADTIRPIEQQQPIIEASPTKLFKYSPSKQKSEKPIVTPNIRKRREEYFYKSCQTVADYEKYLQLYPKGKFVYKAKRAIQQIESEQMKPSSIQETNIKKTTRFRIR